jgi:hypothetical protein
MKAMKHCLLKGRAWLSIHELHNSMTVGAANLTATVFEPDSSVSVKTGQINCIKAGL